MSQCLLTGMFLSVARTYPRTDSAGDVSSGTSIFDWLIAPLIFDWLIAPPWLHLSVGVYHSCASLTVFVSPTTVQCFSWYEWDILFLSHKFEHNGQILITYQDLFHARDELFLHLAQVCANALSSRGVRIRVRRWDVTFGLLSRAKDTPSTWNAPLGGNVMVITLAQVLTLHSRCMWFAALTFYILWSRCCFYYCVIVAFSPPFLSLYLFSELYFCLSVLLPTQIGEKRHPKTGGRGVWNGNWLYSEIRPTWGAKQNWAQMKQGTHVSFCIINKRLMR